MFGTLVIALPSAHEGGELAVHHGGETLSFESMGLGVGAQACSTRYISFYATCEHELLPVTKGHRLALVYNLCRDDGLPKPSVPSFLDAGKTLKKLATRWTYSCECNEMLVHFLHHRNRTPYSSTSWDQLKGMDASLAEALRTSDAFDLFLINVKGTERIGPDFDFHRTSRQEWM